MFRGSFFFDGKGYQQLKKKKFKRKLFCMVNMIDMDKIIIAVKMIKIEIMNLYCFSNEKHSCY